MNWQNRRVLVTGADGFIGSHLVEALVHAGASVRAFCLYNSNGTFGWLDTLEKEIKDSIEFFLGDIRDPALVMSSCRNTDIVFHLAALVSVPYSYNAVRSFIETNIGGTLNVLESVRRVGCERVVHTSTSEVYGTPDVVPIAESHPLKGQSPYSASKIGADKICEAYYCSYETPIVVLRPFNTYGPRQSARAVIPTVITQLLCGQSVVRLGNLEPRRDVTFVDDTVDGFLRAGIAPGIEGEVIHLGTGRSVSIRDMFEVAVQVCGRDAEVCQDEARLRPSASEVMILQSDPSRAAELLNWKAKVSLEDGMTQTADWLREHIGLYAPDRYAT